MNSINASTVQAFYEAVRKGDFPTATAVFAADLTWVEPPFPGHEGGTFHGKENILKNVLGAFLATWSDLTVTPEHIDNVDDKVFVRGTYRGKHHQTARPFEARFVHTWTLRDAKAIRFEMLTDTVQLFRTVRPLAPGAVAVTGKTVNVHGVDVYYREAGRADAPTLLLLHGFPSSSHMFRDLIAALRDDFHLIAPDYPGFGLSSAPSTADFAYTFDNLAHVIDNFTQAIGLKKYALYLQDYGAPVGFRLATAHPERVTGLIIQNGNAYMEGLSPNLAPLANYMSNPTPETEAPVRGFLTIETTRFQYTHGTRHPEKISPESWIYDQYFLDRAGNDQIQLSLFRDYQTNPPKYADWQAYLRRYQPPTLIAWGQNDPFFTADGAKAYLKDLPNAKLHLLDTGHFALEDHSAEIAAAIRTLRPQLTAAK